MSVPPARRAYVALGANQGQPEAQVNAALEALDALPDTRLVARSALYRTPPWGVLDQADFINAVAILDTRLRPAALLDGLLAIERRAGRLRRQRWGPRVLDLDLLHYEGERSADPGLILPHPHLAQRAFVLLPLAELAPDLDIPGRGRVCDLLAGVDCSGIERLG